MARKPKNNGERMGGARVAQELQMRFNPLRGITPSRLVDAMESYERGFIRDMSLIIAAYEKRDDTMRTCSRKMTSSVARCPDTVLIVEGEEQNAEAVRHKEILTRFWANVEVTSAFRRNERGGIRLLKKQMASAESFGFACHEIVWEARPDGSVRAKFIHIPCEYFENTTGRLRFIENTGELYGVDMPDGEWLVTCGTGIGIAGAVAGMSKRLTLNDWLMYSERCGMPGLQATTDAAPGSKEWETTLKALEDFGRRWAALTSENVKFNAVSLAAAGTLPYPELVEAMNKAIAALYRGADLSTISAGRNAEGTGASVQGDETSLLEADTCEMLSETLQQQVDRFVILYETGSDTPLAYTAVSPIEKPNAEIEMKIDSHLAGLGVRLSKNEALRRYQRSEVDAEDDTDSALTPPEPKNTPFGLPNERKGEDTPPDPVAIQCLGGQVAPEGGGSGVDTPEGTDATETAVGAFLGDAGKWREMAERLMADPTPEKAREILAELQRRPSALAKAMEGWMAQSFAGQFGDAALANEKCPECGQWAGAGGVCTNCRGTDVTGANPDSAEKQAAEIGKGKAALKKCLEGKTDVYDAVHRGDIGGISFVYGDEKGGIAHFADRREALERLPETLVRGSAGEPYEKGRKMNITHGGYQATIRTDRDGRDERWVLTAFKKEEAGN